MCKLDDYIEGTHDSDHPANTNEIEVELSELEEQQLWNQELVSKNEKLKNQLKRLAIIEQHLNTFGTLDYDLAKEKQEILNMYLE